MKRLSVLLIALLLSFSGICQNKINLNLPESVDYTDSWFVKYYNDTVMYLIAYDYSNSYVSVPLSNPPGDNHYDGSSIYVYKLLNVVADSYTPYSGNTEYGEDYICEYRMKDKAILCYELIGSFYGTLVKEGCFEDVPKQQVEFAYQYGKKIKK